MATSATKNRKNKGVEQGIENSGRPFKKVQIGDALNIDPETVVAAGQSQRLQ